jgi:phosphoribosylglycinamide formyltransferase-1
MTHFQNKELAEVALVVTNRKEAGVREHSKNMGVPDVWVPKSIWLEKPEEVLALLREYKIDFIALAGFLLKVPDLIIESFQNRILNIHPALLPKFGGPGMYGMNVHRAVKEEGETRSGITIHRVNSEYDKGAIVFQESVELSKNDAPEEIASKVLALEHKYYPEVIERELKRLQPWK